MAGVPTQGLMTIVIQMPESAGGETGDTVGNETPSPANPKQEGNNSANPVKGGKGIQKKLAVGYSLAKGAATQAVNSYVSQIGLTTGDYNKQQRVEDGMAAVSKIAAYGIALGTGHYEAAAAMLISDITSSVFEIRKQKREREIANYQAEQYAKRIGYSVGRR